MKTAKAPAKPPGPLAITTPLDSNAAAKASRDAIPLRKDQIAVMQTLIAVFDNAKRAHDEALAQLKAYAEQCGELCGIQAKDFDLNWDLKAFTPKVPPAKFNGQPPPTA